MKTQNFMMVGLAVSVAIGVGLISGCGPAAPPPEVFSAEVKAEAAEIFSTRCFTCHGKEGAADGPASASLVPAPRNLQDPSWHTSVTDAHIEKIIVGGGAAVGMSPAMPSNPDLAGKPEVVKAIRQHIRDFKK